MMYKKWIKKKIDEHNEGIYTELELPVQFLYHMNILKIGAFMNDLKSVSSKWFISFLGWFDKSYPEGESLDNLFGIRNQRNVEETRQKILAIRKWLNSQKL